MRLTRGEAIWLQRRRLGLTTDAFAGDLHISVDRLRRWEYDREAAPLLANCGVMRAPLTPGEYCAIQRRRFGWTLAQAARRMRLSRVTVWKAEHDRTTGVGAVRRFYGRIGPRRPTTAAPVRVPNPPGESY